MSEKSLTAKPHAFNGAALPPKLARELTPSLVITITVALAEAALSTSPSFNNNQSNFRSPSSSINENDYSHSMSHHLGVQYTVWITEAWRILQWAEPSAALFWEMATMYHTLHVASMQLEEDSKMGGGMLNTIPPILSCGSASSAGSSPFVSNIDHSSERSNHTTPLSPNNSNRDGIFVNHANNNSGNASANQNKRKNSQLTAKELPVWIVGMFLLLHCEDQAFARNVSGEDERRFDRISSNKKHNGTSPSNSGSEAGMARNILQPLTDSGRLDVNSLLIHPGLSPRTRIHAGHRTNGIHCTVFILRHLRLFLLLSALPHNSSALQCISQLARNPYYASSREDPQGNMQLFSYAPVFYDPDEISRDHERGNGIIGVDVSLSLEDLENLSFILCAPDGGLIEEPIMSMVDFFTSALNSNSNMIKLHQVEDLLRKQLENDLRVKQNPTNDDNTNTGASPNGTALLDKMDDLNLEEKEEKPSQPNIFFHKELTHNNLRGTTIIMKPSPHHDTDTGSNTGSNISTMSAGNNNLNGRMHDLTISDCNDVNMYLLQPFENATISACTGCTIVLGAVAGLLNIVDCERTNITSASRRLLICNSLEVLNFCFTPSPPLLVGDNRACQFAPYNTYYDGLQEDLLATGLAAAVVDVSTHHSLFHDAAPPALHCASNKWKQPMELTKLEIPQVNPHPSSSEECPTSPRENTAGDETMMTPKLLPASEFQVVFVPFESEMARMRRLQSVQLSEDITNETKSDKPTDKSSMLEESQYCRNLAAVLQLSPFRLPVEYERRVLVKAERMKSLQQAMLRDLNPEQQMEVEEELRRGFGDWLISSGNLRQVLDLVHMERKEGLSG